MATYALIRYGSHTPGKRPGIRLACIYGGKVETWSGSRWVRCGMKPEDVTIYKTWQAPPRDREVRQAKQEVPVKA